MAPDRGRARRAVLVVAIDLRGYGKSSAPAGEGGRLYAKREMAQDVVAVMRALGHDRFAIAGHDRGGRVGYRLALDHPGRIDRLVLLDIVPTLSMWDGMDAARAMQVYHWTFLAQPSPLPETLIAPAWQPYLEHTLSSWTKAKSLAAFDAAALAHYRAGFAQPERIHAFCEDYRAGATLDLAHDRADRDAGCTLACPTLVLWGDAGLPAAGADPLRVWRETFAPAAEGRGLDCGHFLPEEAPAATLAAMLPFLAGD